MTDSKTLEGSFEQRKGEVVLYEHDRTDNLVRRWTPGRTVALGYKVRPIRATGLQYTSSAGTTGQTEPKWPTVSGGTVLDGTVTWTAEAVGDTSLIAFCSGAGDSVWTADGGATVTPALPSSTRATALIDTTACAVGQILRIVNRMTLTNGEKRDAVFNVKVVD